MDDFEAYLLEALAIVSAWDLPEEGLADAVNAQARLMAGLTTEDLQEVRPDA